MVDRVTNKLTLMIATPIENNGELVGALVGRKDGEFLSKLTDDIKFGEKGYAYMINKEGTDIAHPDRELVLSQNNTIEESKDDKELTPVADTLKNILNEKTGVSNYSYNGKDWYVGYSPVEGTDWILIATADADEVIGAVSSIRIKPIYY